MHVIQIVYTIKALNCLTFLMCFGHVNKLESMKRSPEYTENPGFTVSYISKCRSLHFPCHLGRDKRRQMCFCIKISIRSGKVLVYCTCICTFIVL